MTLTLNQILWTPKGKSSNDLLFILYWRNVFLLVFTTLHKKLECPLLTSIAIANVVFFRPTRISNIFLTNFNVNCAGSSMRLGEKYEALIRNLFFTRLFSVKSVNNFTRNSKAPNRSLRKWLSFNLPLSSLKL